MYIHNATHTWNKRRVTRNETRKKYIWNNGRIQAIENNKIVSIVQSSHTHTHTYIGTVASISAERVYAIRFNATTLSIASMCRISENRLRARFVHRSAVHTHTYTMQPAYATVQLECKCIRYIIDSLKTILNADGCIQNSFSFTNTQSQYLFSIAGEYDKNYFCSTTNISDFFSAKEKNSFKIKRV